MTLFRPVKKDTTNVSTVTYIIDSTTGAPEIAVEHDTGSLVLWYWREGDTYTPIVTVALESLGDSHQDGGIEHSQNGVYRIDLPDAACATGSNGLTIGGSVTGMIVVPTFIPLVDYDPYDTIRLGLTALPDGVAGDSLGLPIKNQLGTVAETATGLLDTGLAGYTSAGTVGKALTDILEDTSTTIPGFFTHTFEKNVALNYFPFLMTDSTNHAPNPLQTVTVEFSFNGDSFISSTNGDSEIGSGLYCINITQTEMNNDMIILKATAAGCDQTTMVLKTES